jgi:hypothetical protein
MFSNIIQVTIAAMALFIFYLKNKREKENIARIILIEIRSTEQRIRDIKENGVHRDTKPIIPINSWEKYKHFFARDLDTDEFTLINDFYHRSIRIEAARIQFLNIFNESIIEKARIFQLKLAENIENNINNSSEQKTYRNIFLEKFNQEDYIFTNAEPSRIIKFEIKNIDSVTTSTAGKKIKKIAKIK